MVIFEENDLSIECRGWVLGARDWKEGAAAAAGRATAAGVIKRVTSDSRRRWFR